MVRMDRFEGRCWLDWWANSSTLLGSAEIAVVITATGGGWDARGHLLSDDDEEREGFVFLCDLDPVFMLRFEDGSTIPVTVHTLEQQPVRPDRIHRARTAVDQPSDRPVVCTALGPIASKVWLSRKDLHAYGQRWSYPQPTRHTRGR